MLTLIPLFLSLRFFMSVEIFYLLLCLWIPKPLPDYEENIKNMWIMQSMSVMLSIWDRTADELRDQTCIRTAFMGVAYYLHSNAKCLYFELHWIQCKWMDWDQLWFVRVNPVENLSNNSSAHFTSQECHHLPFFFGFSERVLHTSNVMTVMMSRWCGQDNKSRTSYCRKVKVTMSNKQGAELTTHCLHTEKGCFPAGSEISVHSYVSRALKWKAPFNTF